MTVTAPASVRATLGRSIYEAAAAGLPSAADQDASEPGGASDLQPNAARTVEPRARGALPARAAVPTPAQASVSAVGVSEIGSGSPLANLALSQLQALVLSLGQPNPNNFADDAHQEAIRPPAQASTTDLYA